MQTTPNTTSKWLPHVLAIVFFLITVVLFFKPLFFDHETLSQHDINQFKGARQSLLTYREATGQEGLWCDAMFSGMPAYLVNIHWGDGPMLFCKRVISVFLQHPVENIMIALVCYYILLLSFQVRPYLAIAGAVAFAYSSYMIIGLGAGHNARIGAIAFMPAVLAGIHLVFRGKRIPGIGLTILALALHLNENHLQMTYYLMLIVGLYGLVQLIWAYREKKIKEFLTNVVILIPVVVIAAGTFFGQFWAITEYTRYSIRGPSELTQVGVSQTTPTDGLTKRYAFEYSDQVSESMTLLIPNFYGGSSSGYFVEDQNSASYQALAASNNNQLANQLAGYTSHYWGESGAPYYAGAIIVFLFITGILLVDRKWLWWVLPLSVLSIMLSWGSNFESFNYFMFDHFPGYNKFRSVTFTLIIILLLMPLFGMMGVEKLLSEGITKQAKKKIAIAFGATGGLCFLILLFGGMGNFTRTGDPNFPAWFTKALSTDRAGLLRGDAFRSLAFILPIFLILYFDLTKKVSEFGFYALLIFLVTMDSTFVAKRSLTKDKFERKHQESFTAMNAADEAILKDKSYYRVYNLQSPWNEARTSFYHHSLGGYHGAKLRRYQDLYDSVLTRQTQQLVNDAQHDKLDFSHYGAFNMLNTKYIVYGPEAGNVIPNPAANGNAWFVKNVVKAATPTEELKKTGEINTRETAVVNASMAAQQVTTDSTASISIIKNTPPYLQYESNSASGGLAVFSEIYYPKGWHATIDGKEVEILRADYVLRALDIPAGKHVIEFKFEPKPYIIGNKITMASNWAVVLIALGCLGWAIRKKSF